MSIDETNSIVAQATRSARRCRERSARPRTGRRCAIGPAPAQRDRKESEKPTIRLIAVSEPLRNSGVMRSGAVSGCLVDRSCGSL